MGCLSGNEAAVYCGPLISNTGFEYFEYVEYTSNTSNTSNINEPSRRP